MNTIFTQLIFDRQLSETIPTTNTTTNIINYSFNEVIHDLIEQTLSIAEQIAKTAIDEKIKLLHTREKTTNISLFDEIINAIENRQRHMIQRTQYNIQQKLKILMNDRISNNNIDQ